MTYPTGTLISGDKLLCDTGSRRIYSWSRTSKLKNND